MTRTFASTALTPELKCTDLRTSLDFYVGVLNFTIQYQRSEDGFAMLERQGSRLMLDQYREISVTGTDRSWLTGPMEKPFGRGINLQMRTDKVDDLYSAVQKAGAPIFRPMEEKWYRRDDVLLGHPQFLVQDSEGYLLRFFEDLGDKPVS
jgi:catechol 2,3-dioxygenase-like lactoylglutathione lyase family enzyme